MPDLIIKCDKDEDLYMLWSTIVDGAYYVGTEADLRHDYGDVLGDTDKRIERAKANGTSAVYPREGPTASGGFEAQGFTHHYDNFGWLDRSRFSEYAHYFLDHLGDISGFELEAFND